MEVHKTYLALGSNLGDRRSFLSQAVHEIGTQIGELITCSKFYRTAPLNPENISSQPEFLNAVLLCETTLNPMELLTTALRIETNLGLDRVAKTHWGPRIIDIDILTYDDALVSEPNLIIPHKEMHNRDFVLVPLKEISPDFVHPKSKKSISELKDDLKTKGAYTHMIATLE